MDEPRRPLEIHWIVEGVSGSPEEGYASALASNRYRVILPARGLTSSGHRVSLMEARRWRWEPTSRPDVIMVGKLLPSGSEADFRALSQQVLSQVSLALRAGVAVVADFNDDHFDHPVLGPHWRGLALTASACTAGSAAMADTVARYTTRPIHVVGDPIASPRGEPRVFRRPSGLARIAAAALSRRGVQRLKLVWYGHPGNWPAMQRWADALAPLAEQQPLLLWIVTQPLPGIAAWVDEFNRRFAPSAIAELAAWDEDVQWSMVRDADAVLIPSDPSDRRKVVKSSNRLADALHAGRFVVASPLPAYRPYADFAELTDLPVLALRWLMDHPEDAHRKVVQGQAAVIANAGLDAVAATWSDVLVRVVDSARSPGMSEQPPVELTDHAPVFLNAGGDDKGLQKGAQVASRETADSLRPTGGEAQGPFPKLLDLHLGKAGKVSDKWEAYFPAYERLFESFRQRSVSLLEIGVQNGGSLEVWADYFPNARHIIGCDIDKKCAELRYSDPRVKIVVGDANHPGTLILLTREAEEFDIVIDDGSHLSSDIINSFLIYFPRLKPCGLYIIEDTHALYRKVAGGGILSSLSAQEFFKKCAELPNLEHWEEELQAETFFSTFFSRRDTFPGWLTQCGIESIEFRTSMIIVRRGATPARLGKRIVVGEEATVFPGVLRHAVHRRVAMTQPPVAVHDGLDAALPVSLRFEAPGQDVGSLPSSTGEGLNGGGGSTD